jgi:nucleoside-diphosphate-sugar epimerase
MKTFTILGTGWLGAKLAENLKSDYNIKVSLRNEDKLLDFKNLGYSSSILNEYNFSSLDELLDTNYLFINYPPSKFDDYLGFLEKIYSCEKIKNIEKIIFISSTSIYPNFEATYNENCFIENPSNKLVFDAEELVLNKTHIIFRASALFGEDRIAGRRLANKKVDFPKTKINFVHRNDVINATIFVIKNHLNGIFNLVSKQHPTKEELYSFNAQKFNFEKPIFSDNKSSIERIIDGSKIENFGFEYKFFDAFNF